MLTGTMHVLTPSYRPAGGVVKILDYVTHARGLGYEVSVFCPQAWSRDLPVFSIDRFAPLADDPGVRWHSHPRLDIRADDLCFVSFPDNYEIAYSSLPRGFTPHRIVHIIQGVRHGNHAWRGGYPLRLLSRPATRISINSIVANAISPYLDERALHATIPLGHDVEFFRIERASALGPPIKVASTTWKSDVGERVAGLLDDRFEARSISGTVAWHELRELYAWADVFLATPGPEEGLYLPGVEAMSAGCLLVTPDVGGNMAYCRPDENCLMVGFEAESDYVAALSDIAAMSASEVAGFRGAGYQTADEFSLDRERTLFAELLERVRSRVDEAEGRTR